MSNKILFIAPSNSIHSIKWIENCIDKKVEIYWVSFYKKDKLLDKLKKSINYIEISTINPFSAYLKLIKLFKKNKFNIVHLHYIGRMTYLLFFIKIKKLIISPWGSDLKLINPISIKGLIVKYILEKADLITVDAIYMKNEIKRFSANINSIEQINFGTNTDFFTNYNLNNKEMRIISLRNLEPLYDIDTLINAVDILSKKYKIKNLSVDIFGQGSQEKALTSLINNKGLNKIIKLRGRYEYRELPQLLNNYGIYISTSTTDAGLAASTSEAMACELTVITADNSENKFWMNDKCGFLFKTGDPDNLAYQINRILNMSIQEKKVYQGNARNKIIKLNSVKSEMTKMKSLYGIY